MNPLLQDPLNINEYFDFDDWEFTHAGPDNRLTFTLTPAGVERLSRDSIALYDRAYSVQLLDPVTYIEAAIRKIIDNSSASQELKARVNGRTLIAVDSVIGTDVFDNELSLLKPLVPHSPLLQAIAWAPAREERRHHRLSEIVTDTYRRKAGTWHTVKWPSDFPKDLVDALKYANLQADYQAEIERHLATPEARFVSKRQIRREVHDHLQTFAKRPDISGFHKQLVADYFEGKARLQLVEFGRIDGRTLVPQALFLEHTSAAEKAHGGLLIFLGGADENPILELPQKNRRQYIDSPGPHHEMVLGRLSLRHQFKEGNDRLRSYMSLTVAPPQFVSPLQFRSTTDVFDALYELNLKRLRADIDFLVSTDRERLTARQMKIAAKALEILATAVALPAAPIGATSALIVGFLAGFGMIVLEAAQGAIADRPEDAEAQFKLALLGYAQLITGAILGDAIDLTFHNEAVTAIASALFEHVTHLEE